jgi:hypothetical protein
MSSSKPPISSYYIHLDIDSLSEHQDDRDASHSKSEYC